MIHKLQKSENPYEQIDRDTIQKIKNPVSLAIWVYLQSKSNNWDVNEIQIREHFNIGKDRYLSAMRELRELCLYEYKTIKKDGKFVAKNFHLYAYPKLRKTVLTENRTDIKEDKSIGAKSKKTTSKETLEAFENLWKDYTRTFLKAQNRKGGNKAKAKQKYIALTDKGISSSEIYNFVEDHAKQAFGHKNLENLLIQDLYIQYKEDN